MERGKDGLYGIVELERKHVGQLYGGDSYVILYSYVVNKKEHHIVYYWLVSDSYFWVGLFTTSFFRYFWRRVTSEVPATF